MIARTKHQIDFIDMVASQLAKIFMKPLHQLSTEKNYFTHVGSMAEILEWSWELCDHYYDQLCNWRDFSSSGENIFEADDVEEFIIAYGHARFIKFCVEKSGSPGYFLEKYRAYLNTGN